MEKSKTKIYSHVPLDFKNRRINIGYSLQLDQQQLVTQGSNQQFIIRILQMHSVKMRKCFDMYYKICKWAVVASNCYLKLSLVFLRMQFSNSYYATYHSSLPQPYQSQFINAFRIGIILILKFMGFSFSSKQHSAKINGTFLYKSIYSTVMIVY